MIRRIEDSRFVSSPAVAITVPEDATPGAWAIRWLFGAFLCLTPVLALAQGTCTSVACQYCGAIAAAGTYGCALGQGGNCQWYTNFVNACIASATALPSSPPPPPEPATPCSTPVRLGTQPRPAMRADSSNEASSSACPCVVLIDPIIDLVNQAGTALVVDPESLATLGTQVGAVTADSAARLLVRVYANAPGDRMTVLLRGDQGVAPNSMPFPFGRLRTILPSDGDATGQQLTVTAVNTSSGAMAFLQYLPPEDFSRGGSDDDAASRTVSLQATSGSTGRTTTPTTISVFRPPVVLVHGLWGDPGDWDNFGLDPDTRFSVYKARYNWPFDFISSSTPAYAAVENLNRARSNSLGMAYNAPTVLSSIRLAVADYHTRRIASAQTDVVAHSMGGVIARTAANLSGYADGSSLGKGPVHKLITIGTPHLGTPIAAQLLQPNNTCVRELLAGRGSVSVRSAMVGGEWISGGVGDLQGNGINSTASSGLSDALSRLGSGQHPVVASMLSGIVDDHNLQTLDDVVSAAGYIRSRCTGNPLADNLTKTNWVANMFGGIPTDGIVPHASQTSGRTDISLAAATGVTHSSGLIGRRGLGFTGPNELDSYDPFYCTIPGKVKLLLNAPIAAGARVPAFVTLP